MLPSELLLSIFEHVAQWTFAWIDIEALRDDERNESLLALALVCKQWSPLALHVLYREIFIPGWDDYDEDDRFYSHTGLPMRRLISTLTLFKGRRSPLLDAVQVLHAAIGRYHHPSSRYDYSVHCDFISVAQAAELCPRLQHLSLRIHCESTGHTWRVPTVALRIFSRLEHLVQLTYSDQQDEMVMNRLRTIAAMRAAAGGDFATDVVRPTLQPLFQILEVNNHIHYLEVETADADGSGRVGAVSLPYLQELRIRLKGRDFPRAQTISDLCRQAPNLVSVALSDAGATQIYALPRHIHTLFLRGLEVALDLREFTCLSHLGIEFPVYEDVRSAPALDTLARLPESIEHVTFFGEHDEHGALELSDMVLVDVGMKDLLNSVVLRTYVQRLPQVKRWTIITDPWGKLVIPPGLSSIHSTPIQFRILHTSVRPWERVRRPNLPAV